MTMKEQRVLVLPGYLNSGPGHWQTRWEEEQAGFVRVQMPDWRHPDCEAWCRALESAVGEASAAGARVLLAAHSLGCLTIAHWAARHASAARTGGGVAQVAGALLVAVPDPHGPAFPADARGFDPVPLVPLPFASIVVASSDDPYGGIPFAERCAQAWGSRWNGIGARGHINAESGLDSWPQGLEWLESMSK
ncbi:MAG: alpha/beta hydrolase [Paraburkholderia sp.]|uniref:RBBP9/YdeN family alpha/beta hydrolase n=1 Tax=Paraburkholderia sp. TaxID=1926495 RepID=UPI001224EB48|nr:alpha/beta hydrolase [Paraburkholderia sp.]TAM06138.1 MAG: alpha/beta hydrolase [Paraburkholderia sp.]TAM28942.1 MAG: alpha/beta hydrolase [Paraburkholderia sp.]